MSFLARAAVVEGFERLVADLGGDARRVYEKAHTSPEQLRDADARVPLETLRRILNASAEETGCDHFGLELGKRRNPDTTMGILGQVFQSARSFGEAIASMFELFHIHSEASLWQLQTEAGRCYAIVSFLYEDEASSKQSQQQVIAVLWRLFSMITQGKWHPIMLSFTFARPRDLAPYRQTFGVPIEFDADSCGIVFHQADLDLPVSRWNADLHRSLYQKAQQLFPARAEGIAETTRTLVRKNLEIRRVGQQYVTQFFPFERRTLQRRLKEQGTSYQQILTEVRVAMAKDALRSSSISLSQLSDRLCYCDVANFTHAFKAQEGMTPRQWRTKHVRRESADR
ncbi:MAG: AraC family transcriptional regulator [Pseudomonadales bacterium]